MTNAKNNKSKKQNRKQRSQTHPVTSGTAPRHIGTTFEPGPTSFRTTMAYSATYGLTEAAAGTGQFQVMRLNSIYDPDQTGVGSTSLGYSTWQNFYSRYRVLGARVIIRFANITGNAQIHGLMYGLNSTFSASPLNWPSEPQSISRLSTGNSGSRSVSTFDRTISLPQAASVTRQQYIVEDNYAAAFGSNPATSVFLIIWLSGKLASVAQTANVDVRIIQDVEFFGRYQSITA